MQFRERNRPAELRDVLAEIGPQDLAAIEATKAAVEAGMSPRELAGHVFKAIREERFYILTHPEEMPAIRERAENLLNGRNPKSPDYDAPDVDSAGAEERTR